MKMSANIAPPYFFAFRGAVETLFNNWTALQLAVEHGMGGQNGKNMALEMIQYISEYCCTKQNIDNYDIEQLLEDIMDDKFHTICEDDSPRELSVLIYRFLQLCRSNNQEQMIEEVHKLPKCNLWLCKPQLVETLPIQADEIVEDDEDETELNVNNTEVGNSPVINGGTDEAMEEDVEPGWSVVRTRRR